MKKNRMFALVFVWIVSLGLVGGALASAHWTGNTTAMLPASQMDHPVASFEYADLSLSQKTAPFKVAAGDRITYTISLLNTGGAAETAELYDVLPLGTTYIPGSLTCSMGICGYDANTRAITWHGALPTAALTQTRYYLTAAEGSNVVYVLDLLKAGWWEPNSWGMVMTFTVPGLSDTAGIDYDAEHGVLYHSDFLTDVIVVTDLFGTYLTQFRCPSPAGFNTGVTYIEGSDPPEVWVTDFLSNQTTRCEAAGTPLDHSEQHRTPGASRPGQDTASVSDLGGERPVSSLPPGKAIETFPNTWAISAIGLVYNPLDGLVRYAHEGEAFNSAEIWDIQTAIPHTALFSISLSTSNPGWPASLDSRDGVAMDPTTGTYFMPDFNGDITNFDDNLIEISPEGLILNAWELDGPGNDSYDGSHIGPVMDIAIVPAEPVLISFAVQVEAAYAEIITNTAYITAPTLSAPAALAAATEIVDTLYESWDFETSAGGWTPHPNSDWQWGIPSRGYAFGPQTAHSGVKAWGTHLAGGTNDTVISHTLTLTASLPSTSNGLSLQWWAWGAETDDARSVLVNGTEVWNDGGDDHQPVWQHHTVDISAYAGASATIQFRLSTCCSPPGPPGWYVDDIALHAKLAPPNVAVTGTPVEAEVPLNSPGMVTFDIQNSGGLGLIWTIVETSSVTSTIRGEFLAVDIPWLEVHPASGIVGKNSMQPVALFFDTIGLPLGFYSGTIAVLSNDEDTPIVFVPITLTVIPHKVYLPILQR